MSAKIGRNDPCPCGSGKKYKSCCLSKEQKSRTSYLTGRKFTAKVLSAGGVHKPQPQQSPESEESLKAAQDYNALMERSFGNALHASDDEAPPLPGNPSQFQPSEESKK